MKLPKELTTVTTFSKILALILFIVFPLFGFLLGISYQKKIDQAQMVENFSQNEMWVNLGQNKNVDGKVALMGGANRSLIELKFPDDSGITTDGKKFASSNVNPGVQDLVNINSIFSSYPPIRVYNLFGLSAEKLESMRREGEQRSGKKLPDLRTWFRIQYEKDYDATEVLEELKKYSVVEDINFASFPALPPNP